FFFEAEDGIRDRNVTGVQTCALPICFLPDAARVSYCLELYRDFFADFQVEKARDLIGFFGLSETSRLKEMSKGMREKVQISLAMSRDAWVFLLDEPISGVDPAARQPILYGLLVPLSVDYLWLV